MHLIQLFLPLYDNKHQALPGSLFNEVRQELVERFGGLTAFSRAPVKGLWQDNDDTVQDELVIYEVMAKTLDRSWWADYRATLETRFRQEQIVVRTHEISLL
ncbi:hypothetical protein IQ22_01478 [Pseudomonas duriflava]|uniref:DUF1330 domain-containing protein n=1 Tax=Pseudomonas duriflava TaxID=459528 RepID=A0A562QFL7_9PSED|nr:hypothetical protein [Pseudomonas duriflava]TWI55552.1 hypothetical protein IQ22_01478 [Pseudomonas duriflava]